MNFLIFTFIFLYIVNVCNGMHNILNSTDYDSNYNKPNHTNDNDQNNQNDHSNGLAINYYHNLLINNDRSAQNQPDNNNNYYQPNLDNLTQNLHTFDNLSTNNGDNYDEMGQNGINYNNNNNILDKVSTQSADFNSYFNNFVPNWHTSDTLVTNNGNNYDEMGQNGISINNENGPGNNLDSNFIDLTSNLDNIGTLANTNNDNNSGHNPNGINGALKIGTSRDRNRMPSRAPSSSVGTLKRKRSRRRDPSRQTTTIHIDKQNFRQAVQEATGGPFKPSMMQNMKNLLPPPHGLTLTLPGMRTTRKHSSTPVPYLPAAAMSLNDAFLIPKQGESSKMGKKQSLREAFMMPPPTKLVMPTPLVPNQMPIPYHFMPNELQMPVQSVRFEQTPNQFVPTEMPMPTHFVPNQMQVPVQTVPIKQTPNQFVPNGVQMPSNETQMATHSVPVETQMPTQSVSIEMTMPMKSVSNETQMPTKSVSNEMQMPTQSMPVEMPIPTESVSSEMPFMLDEAALRYGGTLESLVWPINSQIGQQFINVDKDHWETIPNSPNLKRTKTLSSGASSVGSSNFNPADFLYTFNNENGSANAKTLQNNLKNAASNVIENGVKQVHQIVDISLFCLEILPSSITESLEKIRHGHSLPDGTLNEHILQNLKPENVIKCIKNWLLKGEDANKNEGLKPRISEILHQIQALFEENPFVDDESEHNKKLKYKQIENSDEKRAIVLFFYFRLYRKLVGMLEAPFNGINENNDRNKKCENQTLLCWLSITGDQFKRTLYSHFSSAQQTDNTKIKIINFYLAIDNIKESIDIVQLLIEATIVPLIGQQNLTINYAKLLSTIKQIQSQNIGCLILNSVRLNLEQIVKKASDLFKKSIGATNNFLNIFVAVIQADHDERQGQKWPMAIQNAKIYLKIYKFAAIYLHVDPSNKAVIKSMTNGPQVWDVIKNFIDQSVTQLEALINQWNVAKVHPFCDEQLEMQAINKYIKEHCPKTD